MEKVKIKLNSPEDNTDFINVCSRFISDINLYNGSIEVDAKSIISVFSITNNRILEVEMISADGGEIERFKEAIRKYEVE